MKILMINDYKDTIGGAELYMYTLSEELIKKGYEVKFFFSDITAAEYRERLQKVSIPILLKRMINIKAYYRLEKYLRSYTPDIIHLHGITNELSPSVLLAIKDTPVIMTVHNNLLVNSVSVLSSRTGNECKKRTCGGCINCVGIKGATYEYIKRNFHKILLRKISLYITPSKYMRDFMLEAKFKPVVCIPNGIILLTYAPITYYNHLLYIGRLAIDKGVEYLLRSMPKVIERFPRVTLTLVGDGVEKAYVRKLAKNLNILDNTTFVGSVSSRDIPKFYKDTTIVIVPSIYQDNFPTVCLEAMSVGRPIIGTRMGGIPEIVQDNVTGFLSEPKDADQIALLIIKALKNHALLHTMSKNARTYAEENFDMNKHVVSLEKVYRNFLTMRGGR